MSTHQVNALEPSTPVTIDGRIYTGFTKREEASLRMISALLISPLAYKIDEVALANNESVWPRLVSTGLCLAESALRGSEFLQEEQNG
jgi:hypothetical protein